MDESKRSVKTVIGRERLEHIARSMQSQDWPYVCRGHFILKTQEALYGSGVSPLPESELREVLEFLEQDDVLVKP